MATIPHWNSFLSDGSWDTCALGGFWLPGVASVDVKFPSGIDFQKPRGKRGAKFKDIGDEPAKIKITLQISQYAELRAMPEIIRVLRPRGASLHDPLEIVHPNPNAWGVAVVVIEDIESPQPSAVEGWTLTINALEWLPQPADLVAQTNKPKSKADADAWAPFVDRDVGNTDDGVAGSGLPSRNSAATRNLGL